MKIFLLQKNQINQLYLPYYNFCESVYGRTFFSRLSKASLEKNNGLNELLFVVDENYKKVHTIIEESFSLKNTPRPILLGIQSDDSKINAVTRLIKGVPNYEDDAIFSELIILTDDLTTAQKVEFYSDAMQELEKLIEGTYPEMNVVSFEIPKVDIAYLYAAEEIGYDMSTGQSSVQMTYLYDKMIKDKPLKRIKDDYETPQE